MYVSVKRIVESEEGVTWGEVVDEMVEAKPYLPYAVLTYRFWEGGRGIGGRVDGWWVVVVGGVGLVDIVRPRMRLDGTKGDVR